MMGRQPGLLDLGVEGLKPQRSDGVPVPVLAHAQRQFERLGGMALNSRDDHVRYVAAGCYEVHGNGGAAVLRGCPQPVSADAGRALRVAARTAERTGGL